MPEVNDMGLIREYAGCGSEAAFAALVGRQINFVYSVAFRFTANSQDAQDVTQAVFIILAQKAGSLRHRNNLTGWLYETTRFTAMRFLRTKIRREIREQEAYMQSTVNESKSDDVWRQLAPLLEEGMTRLGEKERTLVALRFFENRTNAETAAILGLGEWAAQKRAQRALEKLRKYFAKRGVASTTSIIAGAISSHSIQVAPATLAKLVTSAALAKGATASSSTLTLIKGALKIMAWTKVKTTVVVCLCVLAVGGGATPFVMKKVKTMRHEALVAKWKVDRPEEMRRERARIESRQLVDETSSAKTIDLRESINAKLTDSPSPLMSRDNNLIDLPVGVNIYAGVPFDVEGTIQLTGKKVKKQFPAEVDNIRIGRRCAKIHLLHGSNWVTSDLFGKDVAALVLHYEDGSANTLHMVAGEQVFDWWFPLFKSGVPERFLKMAPGTERAWTGTNKCIMRPWDTIKSWDVALRSLILYKTTYTNPQPNLTITSMDYVSAKTIAGPFIAGITVE